MATDAFGKVRTYFAHEEDSDGTAVAANTRGESHAHTFPHKFAGTMSHRQARTGQVCLVYVLNIRRCQQSTRACLLT